MPQRKVRLVVAGVFAAFTMVLGAGVAVAAHQFSDVPDSNIFHDDIDFLVSRGVTLGCGGGNYCPDQAVSREQMAAFLARTAAVLSPRTAVATDNSINSNGNRCIIGPITADVERVAHLEGKIYARANTGGFLGARTQVSVNGGSWQDATGAWFIADEGTVGAGTTTGGLAQMLPGNTYSFSLDMRVPNGTPNGGCQLIAIAHHQMPGQPISSSLTPAAAGGGDDLNG